MSDSEVTNNLLSELDARQDQVMRDLDELNGRIEQLMRSWMPGTSDVEDS